MPAAPAAYRPSTDRWGPHDEAVATMFLHAKAKRSARTADSYGRELVRFRAFVTKPLSQVGLGDLQRYLEWRRLRGARKPASQGQIVAVLRSFFRFAHRLGYLPVNPAERVKGERVTSDPEHRWCTPEELRRIADSCGRGQPDRRVIVPVLGRHGPAHQRGDSRVLGRLLPHPARRCGAPRRG